MRKPIKIKLLVLIVCAGAITTIFTNDFFQSPAKSQERQFKEQPFQVRFLDSATGFAIQPESISVFVDGERVATQMRGGNSIYLKVSPSIRRNLQITAKGYKPLLHTLREEDDTSLPIDFVLDPLEQPLELREASIAPLLHSDIALVTGYVVSDDSRQPLADAKVSAMKGSVIATTNERGFFIISVPAQRTDPEGTPQEIDILVEKSGYRTEERHRIQVFPNQVVTIRPRLLPGTGKNEIYNSEHQKGTTSELDTSPNVKVEEQSREESAKTEANTSSLLAASVTIPSTIRVGRNCQCISCSYVEVWSLDAYCKRVLPREWQAGWHSDALKAGAVAIRSYAAYHVYHPRASSYDICTSTCCQAFGDATYSSTDTAVDQTSSTVLTEGSSQIARAEYSAENNTGNCGDCYTGICISDFVCCGASRNGHGRGMCQYGSQRWASGTKVNGVPSGYSPQGWKWILSHYYPSLQIQTPSVDADEQARRDMLVLASQLGFYNADYTSFGKDENWSSDWELRWMYFQCNRYGLFHYYPWIAVAANKRDPNNRWITYQVCGGVWVGYWLPL